MAVMPLEVWLVTAIGLAVSSESQEASLATRSKNSARTPVGLSVEPALVTTISRASSLAPSFSWNGVQPRNMLLSRIPVETPSTRISLMVLSPATKPKSVLSLPGAVNVVRYTY